MVVESQSSHSCNHALLRLCGYTQLRSGGSTLEQGVYPDFSLALPSSPSSSFIISHYYIILYYIVANHWAQKLAVTIGSAWLCKISPQSAQRVGMRPQNIKNFHTILGKESPHKGEPLDRFLKFLGAFIRPTILHQCFKFDVIRFTGYGSYCWETARRSIRPTFSVHPVGKTMRWIEKWMPAFLMASTSSVAMQSLGKIIQRAPAVGAKTWCLYVFFVSNFFCHALRPAHCSFDGDILWTSCVAVYGSILTMFTSFFEH